VPLVVMEEALLAVLCTVVFVPLVLLRKKALPPMAYTPKLIESVIKSAAIVAAKGFVFPIFSNTSVVIGQQDNGNSFRTCEGKMRFLLVLFTIQDKALQGFPMRCRRCRLPCA